MGFTLRMKQGAHLTTPLSLSLPTLACPINRTEFGAFLIPKMMPLDI